MSMALKSAYDKSRDSLAELFSGTPTSRTEEGEKIAANDPLLLENRPESVGPEVFIANGQLWETTGNFERAMENYAKALEKHPDNAAALASIARLHARQNRHDPAIEYFQRAIKAAPSEASLYHDMGLALSKQGRHDEALAAVDKALAIAPGTSRYSNSHAAILFSAGREEAARAELLKNNKPAVAHYNMAYLYYSNQRTDLALQELGQVLAMGPQADGGDPASQRAFERSKDLFDKLGGPATQIAQSLPQIYGAASESAAAVAKLGQDAGSIAAEVRDTASGVTVSLSSEAAATESPIETNPLATAQAVAQSTPAAEPAQAEPTAPVAAPATAAAPATPAAPAKPAAPATTAATAPASRAEVQPASGSMFQLPPELFAPTGNQPAAHTAEAPADATVR